ncbi:hypothetical protein [Arcticibacter eurypsychrophilus]|uniref:hypothetical protein n=1 Tax=Arcticibacter eurypsychrophilus TaxID=1434752 RepID=UPI00084DF98A|nr:hypothetical protein [Arcticibacter eurypsychrophilus]
MNQSPVSTKNGLLDIECASIISKERRILINQLAEQTFKARNTTPTEQDNFMDQLKCEYYPLSDVFGSIVSAIPQVRFYKDIDKAFELLMKSDPEAFATYQALTGMFRTIEKESKVIDDISSAIDGILYDINRFEEEEIKTYMSQR